MNKRTSLIFLFENYNELRSHYNDSELWEVVFGSAPKWSSFLAITVKFTVIMGQRISAAKKEYFRRRREKQKIPEKAKCQE